MSRSYRQFYGKEDYFYNQQPDIGYRKIFARKFRRFTKNVYNEVGSGNWYRKYTESWDIHDYCWSYSLKEIKKLNGKMSSRWTSYKLSIQELYRYVSK